ncbi:Patatin-like phospholipase [uncultured archaeon]|nr:Patatin-like phospholipase [uncultured archaeon]
MAKQRNKDKIRLAIACQGGGSHTAFTAGVLKRILKEKNKKYEIVALSGTSGGAICALLAWYGLLKKDREEAIKLLDSFWTDNSASLFWDKLWNDWIVWTSRLQDIVSMPEVSPYLYPPWAQEFLRSLLEKHIDFKNIETLLDDSNPMLLVGAVDVLSGESRSFKNNEINVDVILASAAIPTFLRAVRIDNKVYWDGLFSQNPPIRDFVKGPDASVKPDEIWVIQVNPERRANEPKSVKDILDRRNELAGNLSLNQEIYFLNTVNGWVDAGHLPASQYKHVELRRIEMLYDLDTASKLDRSELFIRDMMTYGEKQAESFMKQFQDNNG